MKNTTFIYGLFDPRNAALRYIGKSNNPHKRLKEHISESSPSKYTKRYVTRWIRQLLDEGLKPAIEILEECSIDTWEQAERAWIADCKRYGLKLTNTTSGGDGVHDPPPEVRAKMASMKGKNPWLGTEGWMKGKKHSEETKEIMRQKATGRPRTEEERRKLSESKKGKSTWVKGQHLTEEHKRKIGLANSGKKPTQEAIAKRLEKMKGYKHSEEHRQKISDGLKASYSKGNRSSLVGRKLSEEHRQKISEGLKGRIVSEETRKKIGESNSKSLKAYYQSKKEKSDNA
jgi:group I intron endonuclease